MGAAIDQRDVSVEDLVNDAFVSARQGTVIVVEAKGLHPTRVRWLGQQLAQVITSADVHLVGDSLFLILVRHAGPAEAWLVVDRLRRQLARTGWEQAVVASACWPVQGSSPMDVVAAALATLFDERTRVERELHHEFPFRGIDLSHDDWSAAGELLTG